jgi:hypothetical protein
VVQVLSSDIGYVQFHVPARFLLLHIFVRKWEKALLIAHCKHELEHLKPNTVVMPCLQTLDDNSGHVWCNLASIEAVSNVIHHSMPFQLCTYLQQQDMGTHVNDPHFWDHTTCNDYAPDISNKVRI